MEMKRPKVMPQLRIEDSSDLQQLIATLIGRSYFQEFEVSRVVRQRHLASGYLGGKSRCDGWVHLGTLGAIATTMTTSKGEESQGPGRRTGRLMCKDSPQLVQRLAGGRLAARRSNAPSTRSRRGCRKVKGPRRWVWRGRRRGRWCW